MLVQKNNEIVCVETSGSGCFKTIGKVLVLTSERVFLDW